MEGYPTNGSARVTDDLTETIREALADVTIKVDLSALRLALAKNTELSHAIAEEVISQLAPPTEPPLVRAELDEAVTRLETRLATLGEPLEDLTAATRRAVTAGTGELVLQVDALARAVQGVAGRLETAPAEPAASSTDLADAVRRLERQIFDVGTGVSERLDAQRSAAVEITTTVAADLTAQIEKVTDTVLDGFSQLDDMRTELAPGPLTREVADLRADVARLAAELSAARAELGEVRVTVTEPPSTGIEERLDALHDELRALRRRISLSARPEGSGVTEEVLGRLVVETARALRSENDPAGAPATPAAPEARPDPGPASAPAAPVAADTDPPDDPEAADLTEIVAAGPAEAPAGADSPRWWRRRRPR